jgi:hypothetical protein
MNDESRPDWPAEVRQFGLDPAGNALLLKQTTNKKGGSDAAIKNQLMFKPIQYPSQRQIL